jgi:RimJ/RimL family protein N-acetyltransferase
MDRRDIENIATLRVRALQERYPSADLEAGHERFAEQVASWHPTILRTLGDLRAAVALTEPVPARWGAPEAWLHVVTDGEQETLPWIADTLAQLETQLPASLSCRIPAAWGALLPVLAEHGLGVSKVGLGGDVGTMLHKLRALSVVDPADLGLTLKIVSSLEEVRAASNLRRDYFLSHPEHGWASDLTAEEQQKIDARVESQMTQRLQDSKAVDWIILEGDVPVGAFGIVGRHDSSVIGRIASFNICLLPRIQRRGVGTLAYRTMVERAADFGIDHLNGSTSNPGVLRIGARIGRRLDNWLLRRDRPWIEPDALASFSHPARMNSTF